MSVVCIAKGTSTIKYEIANNDSLLTVALYK
jgi:hypothetical protein